jgi:hypothetical protein
MSQPMKIAISAAQVELPRSSFGLVCRKLGDGNVLQSLLRGLARAHIHHGSCQIQDTVTGAIVHYSHGFTQLRNYHDGAVD